MSTFFDELQALIGRHCKHKECQCEIIEILEDGPSIVLYKHGQAEIQCNWFGEAQRRAPGTYTIPVVSKLTDDLHPVIQAIANDDEQKRFRSLAGLA